MTVPPKRRSSSARKRRASHHALTIASTHKCPKCGFAKLPHRACLNCGTYKNKEVIKIKSSLDKKKKK
ncbi:MAG: 50S ribosomal protein L32 [Candidatus Komeilibacteria bacterium CG_4_10_14_0_2_um_filter_37_10]|uniref:Large ribosomal subunit protein bL32 n=1 Tax=Candidatus Komeilibacteria bacterium CG_4_10_14_0_2_um_filter_37_10 TaxID=1974470 RepID=A0A2M7VDG3_9BACT|nr:MAG: 50S ribosomal protein L32 [Candidatus Komeilibacteria bacterium CG_4_10_14_0_2_um_filter_37_10]